MLLELRGGLCPQFSPIRRPLFAAGAPAFHPLQQVSFLMALLCIALNKGPRGLPRSAVPAKPIRQKVRRIAPCRTRNREAAHADPASGSRIRPLRRWLALPASPPLLRRLKHGGSPRDARNISSCR